MTNAESSKVEHLPNRFRLLHISDVQTTAPQYLVRPLIEKDCLIQTFADPGVGKSFFAVDVAACVATGSDFHGLSVKQAPVIYILGEGKNGMGRRFRAWSICNGIDINDAPLFISTMPAALCDAGQAQIVKAAINELVEVCGSPGLIVIDTVARNFGPGNENDTRDMNAFVSACDQLREQHQATVLLIHHTGHGDKTRGRGAMALKGALDAEYRMEKDQNGIVRLESTKMKDAELPQPMAFKLRSVELDLTDDEGNPVESAVLDEVDYTPTVGTSGGGRRGKWQEVAMEKLRALYDDHRATLEAGGLSPHTARVLVSDWREECYRAGISKQTLYNVRRALSGRGEISINGDYIELG